VAFSTFVNNKMRTVLTILGVSIGISMIILLVSIGYGLQQVTIGEVKSIKALTTYDVTTGNSSILALNQDAIDKIKKIDHVVSVTRLLSMSGQIDYKGKKTDILVNDAPAEYVDLTSPKMTVGVPYMNNAEMRVMITNVVANAFNIKPADIIGEEVTLNFYVPNPANDKAPMSIEQKYTVSGVISDDSASYLFLPPETVSLPVGINFNALKVKVATSEQMAAVKAELMKMGYTTSSIGETINQIDKIFRYAQVVLFIFGIVALVVASIGMFNTLTISLLERTKEIGIMKALGAKDKSIYTIFLTESTIIAFFGGLVGIFSAFVLGYGLNIFVTILAQRAGGEAVAIFQPPTLFILLIFTFSLLVGLGTGLYPARRAARLNPLDALRYE
jgi:putative ABC transport system permease protein